MESGSPTCRTKQAEARSTFVRSGEVLPHPRGGFRSLPAAEIFRHGAEPARLSFIYRRTLNLKQLDLRPPGPGRAAAATLFKVCSGTGLNARPGTGTFWEHPFDVAPDGRVLFNS